MKEWESLELLRHSRHDWLNDIQLIKAQLAMQRVAEAEEVIEEVTRRAHNESKLTNLHIPKVAERLLTFNWQEHFYRLQVEVIGPERDLSPCDQDLVVFLEQLFEKVDDGVDKLQESHLLLTLLLNEEGNFLTVDFSGRLNETKAWDEHWIDNDFAVCEYDINEDQFILTVQLP